MRKWIGLMLLMLLLLTGCSEQNVSEHKGGLHEGKNEAEQISYPSGKGIDQPYYIKVNCQTNTVTVYSKDEKEDYSVPVCAMLCSTGTATPQNEVCYPNGENCWPWLSLQDGVYGQYCTQIKGNILFHSVPYTQRGNKASLEYEEFDKLGTAASAGCIRLQVKDAKWIYDNAMEIYAVEFYSDDDPGSLGKPTAPKISGNVKCRGWDPTDESDYNPWLHPDAPTYYVSGGSDTPSVPVTPGKTTPQTKKEPDKEEKPEKPEKKEEKKPKKEAEKQTPTKPTKPVEPVEPVEPIEPVEPVEPIEPVEPTEPAEPENGETEETPTELPEDAA